MSVLPTRALEQHVIVLGKTRSGKSSVMRGMVERLLDESKPVCVIDPKGDWYGIKSSADGKQAGYPVVIFGGEHADVPINAHSGTHVAELVATGNRPCIIDLGGWMVGERTRFYIEFASTLFRLTRGRRWLVVDEVHNFCPQGKVMDPDAGKMLHWSNRLASEGLGKGLQIIAASQRPQKVHKDFVTSCETLIAMRVIHPLDRGAIKDWIDGCPDPEKGKEVLASLASLPRGSGWVWSPEIGFGPRVIAFPMFKTYDSFKAPTGEAATKLKGWAEVDLEDVKAKLAAVVQEAEANDPKRLKVEIARLKSEAAKAARVSEVEVIDPNKLIEAENRGHTRGRAEAVEALRRAGDAISGINKRLPGITTELATVQLQLYIAADAAPAPRRHQQTTAPPPRQDHPRRAPVMAGNGSLPKVERLILTALAQYPDGRKKAQVAILAGYAVSGGAFNNGLGALRSRGWITRGEPMQITEAGLRELGSYDPLPNGRALLDHWLGNLGKAERLILTAAADAYPKALNKQQVAVAAGYEANGGAFNNALGRLRSLELIKGRGEIKASDDLFG